jgi:hypothetical protein
MPLKPWPKGISGNPGGRRKTPLVDRRLEQALSANDSATAKVIADKLISMGSQLFAIADFRFAWMFWLDSENMLLVAQSLRWTTLRRLLRSPRGRS